MTDKFGIKNMIAECHNIINEYRKKTTLTVNSKDSKEEKVNWRSYLDISILREYIERRREEERIREKLREIELLKKMLAEYEKENS